MDEVTLPDGTTRKLGNKIPEAGLMKAWPVFGDTPNTPLISRARWDEFCDPAREEDPALPYIHDQDGVGQCNCDAAAALMEYVRNVQGLPFVKLSAADLYDRINGGSDNGSMLEDAMHELLTNGIGTAETAGLIWKRGMRGAPARERARFKALEVFLCPTFEHCFSASIARFGLVSGVMWHNNYTPDSDGWLPLVGRGGGGGHAVFGYGPAKRGSTYGIWHDNSWGQGWGRRGRCIFPETMYERDIGGWYAVRAVTDEGGVVPLG